jgi:hypothetical protein
MAKKVVLLFLALGFVMSVPGFAGRAVETDGSKYWGDPQYAYLMDTTPGTKPTVWLRTDQVVYISGQGSISLTLDVAPNGHNFEKTMFLYLQNLQTGEIRYINVSDGLLDPGEITDYAGDDLDDVQPYPIPDVEDFVIFGSGGQVGAAIPATADLAGNHQFVWEFRDVTGTQVFQRVNFYFVIVTGTQELPASITEDTTLVNTTAYILNNRTTFVEDGATLTIMPGTHILGAGQFAALVIAQGGLIDAKGTAARPIVMTSAQPVGERVRADWGGLILNGRAPINVPGGVAIGEGDTGEYGGGETPDPMDSSGSLRYVRVEFAGIEFSPDNELNGIAFQGTGSGTHADFLQVHFNEDDGVEFFGGTTNAKHLVLTGNADDSLDWTEGWTGKVQFVVAQQRNDDADQGIEADNNGENNELTPRSDPTIYNMTIIGGAPLPETDQKSDIGTLIREGTAVTIKNIVVMGMGQQAVVIDQDSTVNQANQGNIVYTNSMFFGNGTRGESGKTGNFGVGENVTVSFDVEAFMTATGKMNRVDIDPMLRDPFNFVSPDYRPMAESPVLNINYVANPPDDGFFEPVHYIGAMTDGNDWTVGWTTHSPN